MGNILGNKTYNEDLARVINKFDFSGLKNKSVMITGGLGLIGSAVADLLFAANKIKNLNIKIFIASRSEEKFNKRYGNIEDINFIYYDALEQINFNEYFDYIIHCAGLASPDMYVNFPVETLMTSVDSVRNLLEYCKNKNVMRFLYVSSSEVYGLKKEEKAFIENMYGTIDIDNVRSSYAIGKITSEVLCRSYLKEYNVDCVIVRPGHIFGPTASEKDKKVSSEFAYLAAQGKSLTLKSSGLQKRSYCYTLDCAAAILVSLIKGVAGESYNIGHDEITSIKEMAGYMAEAGGVELSVSNPTESELKAFNPMNNSSLDIQKIKDIGYQDSFSVREACRHTIEIIRDCLK